MVGTLHFMTGPAFDGGGVTLWGAFLLIVRGPGGSMS